MNDCDSYGLFKTDSDFLGGKLSVFCADVQSVGVVLNMLRICESEVQKCS